MEYEESYPRPLRQLHHHNICNAWRTSTRWAYTRAKHRRGTVADTLQRRLPLPALTRHKIIRHRRHRRQCNDQYAFDPESMDYRVIEVNARHPPFVSPRIQSHRATPQPSLPQNSPSATVFSELKNSVTRSTSAFFEPALDYVTPQDTALGPRQIHGVNREIGSSMKSVGEVAIGRYIRGSHTERPAHDRPGMHGFVENRDLEIPDIEAALKSPTDKRIFVIAKAFAEGHDDDTIHNLTRISRWFLFKLKKANRHRSRTRKIRQHRPHFYNGTRTTSDYNRRPPSIVVLGSVPTASALRGIRLVLSQRADDSQQTDSAPVMINYNPETVSTDYDMCDRLYFDELTLERVIDITDLEMPHGVIVSIGGQIPNNLAMRLDSQKIRILGTSAHDIDRAEDRHKFSSMCDALGIDQPRWNELTSMDDIYRFVDEVGFPVLIRPAYVLSGAAMNVVSNKEELKHFLEMATEVSKQYPVVVTEFIENAKEIEMDAVARNGEMKGIRHIGARRVRRRTLGRRHHTVPAAEALRRNHDGASKSFGKIAQRR